MLKTADLKAATLVRSRLVFSAVYASLTALLAWTAIAPAYAQTTPAPAHHTRHSHRRAIPAPVGVQPAAPVAANATSPAPVPNEAVTSPLDHKTPSATVAPSVFQLHYPPQGEGYVTGSSPQAMDDRNAAKATGVQATIPLPQ